MVSIMDSIIASNVTSESAIISFTHLDYGLFIGMLTLSALIGLYFGFFHRQDTVDEYVFGGKNMHVFPIAMSLVSSNTSGIELLSAPADVYKFGGNYFWICLSIIFSSSIGYYVYIPVFLKLQVTSTYEYLNMRFDQKIRVFASFLYTLSILLSNPIIIYLPALAFSQATGVNVHLITPIVCCICIFYTTIGGLKAVVWSDTLQTIAIAISMVIVLILGILSTGGVSAIYETSLKGHRLDVLDFNINPTVRDGFWAFIIGATVNWINQFGVNQGTVQRLSALSTLKKAKTVALIFCISTVIVKLFSSITGLIMYTKYSDCDPVLAKIISKHDQLVPYYVMDVSKSIPGLSGLFIAGVFSAGLSTLSTTLNTLSCTIYEDFVLPFLPPDITERKASNIMKLIAAITGIISTLLVLVVEYLGGMLQLIVSFNGITGGPLLGLFTLGMLFPSANAKGALWGGIVGLVFSAWVIVMNQWYNVNGAIKTFAKPLSVEGCDIYINASKSTNADFIEEPFVLFRITFWYYITFGIIIVITVGLIVSWITSSEDDIPVHPDFISPIVHRFYYKESDKVKPYVDVKLTKKSTWR